MDVTAASSQISIHSTTSLTTAVTNSPESNLNLETEDNWTFTQYTPSLPDITYTSTYTRFRKFSIAIGVLICVRITILCIFCCPWAIKSFKEYPIGYEQDYLFFGSFDLEWLLIPEELRDNRLYRYTFATLALFDLGTCIAPAFASIYTENLPWITFLYVLWTWFMSIMWGMYVSGTVFFILNSNYLTIFWTHLLLLPIIVTLVAQSIRCLRKLNEMGYSYFPKPNATIKEVQNWLKEQKLNASTTVKDSIRERLFEKATPVLPILPSYSSTSFRIPPREVPPPDWSYESPNYASFPFDAEPIQKPLNQENYQFRKSIGTENRTISNVSFPKVPVPSTVSPTSPQEKSHHSNKRHHRHSRSRSMDESKAKSRSKKDKSHTSKKKKRRKRSR